MLADIKSGDESSSDNCKGRVERRLVFADEGDSSVSSLSTPIREGEPGLSITFRGINDD